MEINNLIGRLLLHNNCVVIPGFGGFVAKVAPASVDYEKGKVHPPKKLLTFNKGLVNNDGLLITAFSEKNNVSYNDAHSAVNLFSKQSLTKLNEGERLNFPDVGYLFLNEEGKITFEQDRFFNLLLQSYGLSSVDFIPEAKLEAIEEKEGIEITFAKTKQEPENDVDVTTPVVQMNKKDALPEKKTNGYKKLVRYVAAAALIPIAFYSFWIPMKTEVLQSHVLYKDDFNPFKNSVPNKYQQTSSDEIVLEEFEKIESLDKIVENLPENVDVFSYKLNEDLYVPVKIDKTFVENQETTETTVKESVGNYHLIVGSFGDKENALSLIESLRKEGEEAFIVDYNNGFHRVSVKQEANKKAILDYKKVIENKGFESWVLNTKN